MSSHIKSDIDAYLAGTLAESRRREVESHTAGCEACRKALQKARTRRAHQHREALKRASSEGLPDLLMNRLSRRGPETPIHEGVRWRWMIVVAFLGLAVYGWYKFQPKIDVLPAPSIPQETVTPLKESPKEAPRVVLTAPEPASVEVSSNSAPAPRRRRTPPAVSEQINPATSSPGSDAVPMSVPPAVDISTP